MTKTKTPATSFKLVPTVAEVLGDRYTAEMKQAFPDVPLPYGVPFGYLALLQLRMPRDKVGSFFMPDDVKDIEQYRTQSALVRACAPMAFHDRQNGKPWSEGAWYKPGDFIRCPMYGGDRFDIELGVGGQKVTFMFIKDADAVAPVVGDPLTIKTS
jgi:hypothetical protein